jgi:hypothetical protein
MSNDLRIRLKDEQGKEQWLTALRYVDSIGKIASNFSTAVRAITLSELKYGNNRSPEARDTAQRYVLPWLRRSPSLKAVFYYAAESIYEEQLEHEKSLTLSKLLDIFAPGEVATIMGLVYLKRRLQIRVEPTEWERLSALFQIQMELGTLVGSKIPMMGAGAGMLIGGLRVLGFSALAMDDVERFKDYRRDTKRRGLLFDLEHEEKVWGCNHLHIASLLVQNMGYGLQAGLGIGLGVSSRGILSPQSWFSALDSETQCWQVAISLIEALHTGQEFPRFIPVDHELYLDAAKEDALRQTANTVLAKGSTFHWTERTRRDLSEELHIRLGLVFDKPHDDENAIFEEIEGANEYVDLAG